MRDAVDFRADCADFALQRFDRLARIVGAQRFAQSLDQSLDRRQQIFTRAVLARGGDALGEIAYRALERDDGVSGRKIGEAARHRGELGAQRVDIGGRRIAPFALLATQFVEALAQLPDFRLQSDRSAFSLGAFSFGEFLCDPFSFCKFSRCRFPCRGLSGDALSLGAISRLRLARRVL